MLVQIEWLWLDLLFPVKLEAFSIYPLVLMELYWMNSWMRVRFSALWFDSWLTSARLPMCVTDCSVPQVVVCRGCFCILQPLGHNLRHDNHYAALDRIDRGVEYNSEENKSPVQSQSPRHSQRVANRLIPPAQLPFHCSRLVP
jgi:hypothetical protein